MVWTFKSREVCVDNQAGEIRLWIRMSFMIVASYYVAISIGECIATISSIIELISTIWR